MAEKNMKKETVSNNASPNTNEEMMVSFTQNLNTKQKNLSKEANSKEIMRVFNGLEEEYKRAVATVIPDDILVEEIGSRLIRYSNNLTCVKELIGRI